MMKKKKIKRGNKRRRRNQRRKEKTKKKRGVEKEAEEEDKDEITRSRSGYGTAFKCTPVDTLESYVIPVNTDLGYNQTSNNRPTHKQQ